MWWNECVMFRADVGNIGSYNSLSHSRKRSCRVMSALVYEVIGVSLLCVRLVMKTDDDAFVNMFALIPLLADVTGKTSSLSPSSTSPPSLATPASSSLSSPSMLLMCNVWRNESVQREGRWQIYETEWRYEHWPTFCQGLAFIMTMNFVIAANQLVHRVPRLWLDDVSRSDSLLDYIGEYVCFVQCNA